MAASDPLPSTSRAAGEALAAADAARRGLAARGRWARRYFLAFAAASLVVVPAIGLGGTAGTAVGTGAWAAVIAVLVVWAARQPVQVRGSNRLHGLAWGTWGVLYAAALVLGLARFPGDAAYWLPASLLVAVPLVAAAVAAGRAGQR